MGALEDAITALDPIHYYPLTHASGDAVDQGHTPDAFPAYVQFGATLGNPSITPVEVGTCLGLTVDGGRLWNVNYWPLVGNTFWFRIQFNVVAPRNICHDPQTTARWGLRQLADGRLQYYSRATNSGAYNVFTGNQALVAGQPYSVAITRRVEGAGMVIEIWIDGVLDASATYASQYTDARDDFAFNANKADEPGYLNAYLQYFAAFNYALSAGQQEQLQAAIVPPPPPIYGSGTTQPATISTPAGTSTEPFYGPGSPQAVVVAAASGLATEPHYGTGDPLSLLLATPDATVQRNPYRVGGTQGLDLSKGAGHPRVTKPVELFIEDSALDRAPTAIVATVENSTPGATLTFSVDSVSAYTATADSTGALGRTSVPVGSSYAAGAHVLSVSDGTTSAEAAFTLARDGATPARVVAADAPAALVPDAQGRWALQDALPGGLGSWVMDPNPTTWSGPLYELDAEPSTPTSVGGRSRISGGNQKALEWSLEGYCPDETFYNQLEAYAALNRRLWVIDHRGRAWKCAIIDLQLEPRKRQRTTEGFNDWAHDYSLSLAVLDPDWSEPS